MIEKNKPINNLVELLFFLDEHGISGYRRYQNVKNYLQAKAYEKNIPITGHFELTPCCNFDCHMCYVHLDSEHMGNHKELTVKQWLSIMDRAIDQGMLYAELTGGECLLYSGFREIYKHLQDRGVHVMVMTNGFLLDQEYIEWFSKRKPSCIQITVYGSDDEVYKKVTGVAAFDRIKNAIKLIQDAGIVLRLAITPNAYALDDFEAVYRFVREIGAEYGVNSKLFPAREETGHIHEEYDVSVDDYIDIYKKQAAYEKIELISMAEDICDNLADIKKSEYGTPDIGLKCNAGRSSFQVSWDGSMHVCTNLNTFVAYPLEYGFDEAWKKINDYARNFVYPLACSNCGLKDSCTYCPAEHITKDGLIECNINVCERTRRLLSLGLIK